MSGEPVDRQVPGDNVTDTAIIANVSANQTQPDGKPVVYCRNSAITFSCNAKALIETLKGLCLSEPEQMREGNPCSNLQNDTFRKRSLEPHAFFQQKGLMGL